MSNETLRVGIIGATGYTGSELARLLANHPHAELRVATASGERAGQKISELFPSLRGVCDLECQELNVETLARDCDFVFLALPHGKALELVPQLLDAGLKVCDLGADFRLRNVEEYKQWYHLEHSAPETLEEAIYGLPELHRDAIKGARLVANPGCFPTSAILALAPLVEFSVVEPQSIIVDSASGTSGAGRSSFGLGMHHPEIGGDFKAYNVASHRHTPEIEQGLNDAGTEPYAAIFDDTLEVLKKPAVRLSFTAHLLPVTRGILSTCYATLSQETSHQDAHEFIRKRYESEPFVRVLPLGQMPSIKGVVGSNFCDISAAVDARTNRVIVVSALDNLLKGASGQAIQNMNLMCGFEETTGLHGAPVFP